MSNFLPDVFLFQEDLHFITDDIPYLALLNSLGTISTCHLCR